VQDGKVRPTLSAETHLVCPVAYQRFPLTSEIKIAGSSNCRRIKFENRCLKIVV